MKAMMICIVVFAAVHFVPGCKKAGPIKTGPDTLRLSPNALSYISVPVGKYRIFKDSATGILDSVLVVKNNLTIEYRCCDFFAFTTYPPYYAQGIEMTWEKKNPPVAEWLKVQGTVARFFARDISNVPFSLMDTSFRAIFFMLDNEQPIPSLNVDGHTYNNVFVESVEYATGQGNNSFYVSLYYWAKGIGLIKQTIANSAGIKTTYLVRYN
jgi:hypothetical protein